MEASGKQAWVGISDLQTEGVYRYVDGQVANVNRSRFFLYYFKAGEPNNGGGREHCVHYWREYGELNDADCNYYHLTGADFHGLCEIEKKLF